MEGTEAGVYYRGEGEITDNFSVKITLPEYVDVLAKNFTVHITPILDDDEDIPEWQRSYIASRVKQGTFTVHGTNGKFYWIVYGERQSVVVEPLKSDTTLHGDGPYRWLTPK